MVLKKVLLVLEELHGLFQAQPSQAIVGGGGVEGAEGRQYICSGRRWGAPFGATVRTDLLRLAGGGCAVILQAPAVIPPGVDAAAVVASGSRDGASQVSGGGSKNGEGRGTGSDGAQCGVSPAPSFQPSRTPSLSTRWRPSRCWATRSSLEWCCRGRGPGRPVCAARAACGRVPAPVAGAGCRQGEAALVRQQP
jgi:hypothetical protein